MKQIKTNERVKENGEIFTAPHEVARMIALCHDDIVVLDNVVLEPCCGTGNFVVAILQEKLEAMPIVTAKTAIMAVSAIIGIDIMADNVAETKQRIIAYLNQYRLLPETIEQIKAIIDTNIVVGDIMTADISALVDNRHISVIIGNPPYQEMIKAKTSTFKSSAKAIYQLILLRLVDLYSDHMVMIIPARWMSVTAAGKSMKEFRKLMLSNHTKAIIDIPDASECFPAVIDGGVCIVDYMPGYSGGCNYQTQKNHVIVSTADRDLVTESQPAFVRDITTAQIVSKIITGRQSLTAAGLVSPKTPYGLTNRCALGTINQSNGNYLPHSLAQTEKYNIKVYGYDYRVGGEHCLDIIYIADNDGLKLRDCIDKYKLLIPAACGTNHYGEDQVVYPRPIVAGPSSVATEKYISIGCCSTEAEVASLKSYLETKTVRFLVSAIKNTKNITRNTFAYVPVLAWDRCYDDEYLYRLFGLTELEIGYIEKTIRKY